MDVIIVSCFMRKENRPDGGRQELYPSKPKYFRIAGFAAGPEVETAAKRRKAVPIND